MYIAGKRVALAAIVFWVALPLYAQQGGIDATPGEDVPFRYHGRVFADANGNGAFDEGEKGVAGVRVGDFWKTVLTDAEGRYDFESVVKRSPTPPEIPVIYVALPPGFSVYRSEDRFRFVDFQGRSAQTGEPLWERKTDLGLSGGLAIMGEAVYAVSREGVIVGIDLATGEESWRRSVGCPIFAYPAVSGNTLYVVDWGGTVYAFSGK
jgi:hypothetical protein